MSGCGCSMGHGVTCHEGYLCDGCQNGITLTHTEQHLANEATLHAAAAAINESVRDYADKLLDSTGDIGSVKTARVIARELKRILGDKDAYAK